MTCKYKNDPETGCGNTDCRDCYVDPKKFWESVTQTAALVETWPKWMGGDGTPIGEVLKRNASDGTEAL